MAKKKTEASRQATFPGLIHHSDRGSPYAPDDYIRCLDEMKMIRSMSKKGDCWDNAVAENFYNIKRIHTYNKNLSPAEAEIALYLQKKSA